MEYDLSRIDYALCGITYPDTLKILPPIGQKLDQKFVIGDKNGVLQCLSVRDEEPVVQFKTLPGKPITSVQLTTSTDTQVDKIFSASGNEVKGYTRKGKVFLTIETSLTETITSMCVLGGDLILSSGHTVTCYRDLQEHHSYVCEDRVLDIAASFAPNNTRVRLLVLIANKGAIILENGKLVSRTAIASGPSRLAVPPITHTPDIYAFYGAGDGSIGLITYEECTLSSTCLMEGRGLGPVVCLGWLTSSGNTHLSVGRHDGSVQLYLVNMENLRETPRLKYTYFSGEPVTSVNGGCVGTEEPELLVATFSGRIFALRSSRLVPGAHVSHEALAARRAKLEAEVERLEKQTANEREKYHRRTRSPGAGAHSAPPLLDIQCELLGASSDGWQQVVMTSAVPLDMLLIYCNKKLELHTDVTAVLSVCSSQDESPDQLATIRCQAGTKRLWVKFRYTSGASFDSKLKGRRMLIYALPAGAPRVSRLMTLRLPALPHYSQHSDLTSENENCSRTWCQLHVTGSFSVAEMTSWLLEALPGDLPRPAANVSIVRTHSLFGTILICQYQRGLAEIKSDNVSTIAVIQNIISNCSVENNILVEIACEIPGDCCLKLFKKIEELFKLQYQKKKDIALKKAISMLDLNNSGHEEGSVLCQDYARVWESRDSAEETQFNEILETILRWYLDRRAMSLHNDICKDETAQLCAALNECKVNDVMKILSNDKTSLTPKEY